MSLYRVAPLSQVARNRLSDGVLVKVHAVAEVFAARDGRLDAAASRGMARHPDEARTISEAVCSDAYCRAYRQERQRRNHAHRARTGG